MNEQTTNEQKMNEKLLRYYDYAEIRYAISVENEVSKLIFASIRLLPKDKPASYSSDSVSQNIGDTTIYARKVVVTAETALNWYRKNGELSAPVSCLEQKLLDSKADKVTKSTQINLTDETAWGDFGNPLREKSFISDFSDNGTPFLGYASDRIHRRFGDQTELKELLKKDKTQSFLKQNLFIDLKTYHEYLGSMVLILPNPILESIEDRLVRTADGEKRLLKFTPYPSQNLSNIKLIAFETYLGNLKNLRIIENEEIQERNGLLVLPHSNPFQSQGYFLLHDELGCLEYRQPTSYLRQVNFRSNIHTGTVEVRTKESERKNAKDDNYEISVSNTFSEQIVGEVTPDEIYDRVINARRQRGLMTEKIESGQVWFSKDESGSREKALKLIRDITSQARDRVLFFDPYFGDLQITQFALLSSVNGIATKIITSRHAFIHDDSSNNSGKINNSSDGINDSQIKQNTAQAMFDEIQRIKQQLYKDNLPLECRVLDSNNIPLHDRFLVVDNNVWFIGHSFNHLGLQNSFMIKVPAPEEVLSKLEAIESQAIDLESFINKQKIT